MSKQHQRLHLGYLNSSISGELLSLCREDRRRHLYVIGQTGCGKTTFLKNCIRQDIHQGAGLALIDPYGDLAGNIVDAVPRSRVRDVVFFDPLDRVCPIGFNPLAWVPAQQRAAKHPGANQNGSRSLIHDGQPKNPDPNAIKWAIWRKKSQAFSVPERSQIL